MEKRLSFILFIVTLRDILKGMRIYPAYYLPLIILIVFSCSGYEKLLKSNDYEKKYQAAMKYYHVKEDYVRASALFDQIAPVYKGTEKADSVYYFQAMSYFKQNDYMLSGHYFRTYAKANPGSPFLEESSFMGAYCYYLSSPRPELDQTNSINAIQALQLFLIRFPESKRFEECKQYLIELKDKLVEKSYLSAKLYFDLEDYKASIIALNNSLTQFPESKYREEIMYMIVKSSYLLAEKSIPSKQKERFQDAVDEYYSFLSEFPQSKYSKEVNRYYKLSSAYLANTKIDDEIEE